jgi:uncharacterized protein YdaU (DUF1376 family)
MTGPSFPWMRWYPRDFASSTRGWPLIARAVYRELLDAAWDLGGALPVDEAALRDIARASPAEWRIAWPLVERKFPIVDGGRRNARLEQHREVAMREYLGRSEGAKAANRKRWGDRSANRSAISERSLSESVSDQSATNERIASSSSTSLGVRGLRRRADSVEAKTLSQPEALNGTGEAKPVRSAASSAVRAVELKPGEGE